MIHVLVVDDHPVVRAGWRHVLDQAGDMRVTAEAGGRDEALACFQQERFHVVLLDLFLKRLDGGEDFGLCLLKDMCHLRPRQGVLIMSVVPDRHFLVKAFNEGAKGYLSKSVEPDVMVAAVRAVAAGRVFLHDHQSDLVASLLIGDDKPMPHERLTAMELQVFLLLGAGHTPAQIAAQLGKSVSTVNNQRQACLEKSGLKHTAEIMLYCLVHGLIVT
jgi:DNA-binding NarL/FixJ family response regulator